MNSFKISFFNPSEHKVLLTDRHYKRFKLVMRNENVKNIISRKNIFTTIKKGEFILAIELIAFWAYPTNSHGVRQKILKNKMKISKLFKKKRSLKDFEELEKLFKEFRPYIGFTTFTKFLYFLKFSVNKIPCVILDSRIIHLFKNNQVSFFKSFSTTATRSLKFYYDYLKKSKKVANRYQCKPDQVELAIYLLGGKYPL